MVQRSTLQFPAHVILVLFMFLLGFQNLHAQIWTQTKKLDASDRQAYDELGMSVDISGNYAIVGAPNEDHDVNGNNIKPDAGSAYIYEKDSTGHWSEVQKIVAFDRDTNDRFGWAVSISGDNAVVSAMWQNRDAQGNPDVYDMGGLYVYHRDPTGIWIFIKKLVAPDRDTADYLGYSLAMDRDHIVAGSHFQDFDAAGQNLHYNAGAAYVFVRDTISGSWSFQQKIVEADRLDQDYFGWSVAISGDQIVVGAVIKDSDSAQQNPQMYAGAAYVFALQSNGIWLQTDKITASDRTPMTQFGQSVGISGDRIVVGANFDSFDVNGLNAIPYAGSIYIFEKTSTGEWTQVQKIVAPDRTTWNQFGTTVAISGDSMMASSPANGTDAFYGNPIASSGSVYLYMKSGNTWSLVQKITSSDRGASELFGLSLGMDGNELIVGAYGDSEDENGAAFAPAAGSAFVWADTAVINSVFEPEMEKIAIYPNPGTGIFSISTVSGGFLTVFDAQGRTIEEIEMLGGNIQLDLTGNPDGVYFLRLVGNGTLQNKRIVLIGP